MQALPGRDEMARHYAGLGEDTEPNNWPWRNSVLYEHLNPQLWVQVCVLAMALTNNAVLLAWFMLEFVNGLHRQEGLWDVGLAVAMLDAVKLRVETFMALHPRRARLLEMWAYHGGWVYHPAGEFAKAAECHQWAVEHAVTDRARAQAAYNAAYEELNAAIAQGDHMRMEAAYGAFAQAKDSFFAYLKTDSDEDVRWRINLYCHCMLFTWLLNKPCPETGEYMQALALAPPQLVSSVGQALPLMRALEAQRRGDDEEALRIVAEVDEQTMAEWRSFAMLLRAELLFRKGDQAGAAEVRTAIAKLAGREHGAHLAKAVAQRQLTPA